MTGDDDIEHFFIRAAAAVGGHFLDVHHVAHALEDLPADARRQAAMIAQVPAGSSLRRKIAEELENAGLDSYGNLELLPLLHFLSQYPVRVYTYQVSDLMSRGERPSPQKLRDLSDRGQCRATINLCAEMRAGDDPVIAAAGLGGTLRTWHIPLVDMQPPTPAQVIQLLDLLSGPGAVRTYVHCEAGMGRTGVMTACYRMAVMGWSASDALSEAERFGCSVPMQLAFIVAFGATLQESYAARAAGPAGTLAPAGPAGRYPLKAPGSVQPTPQEQAATIASLAHLETGQAP